MYATARRIRRRHPSGLRASLRGTKINDFVMFLMRQGTDFSVKPETHLRPTGFRKTGKRGLFNVRDVGPFRVATYHHPTKKPTKGRVSSLTWRIPEAQNV